METNKSKKGAAAGTTFAADNGDGKNMLRGLILRAEDVLGKLIYKLEKTPLTLAEMVAMINSVHAFVDMWEQPLEDIRLDMLNIPGVGDGEKNKPKEEAERKILEQISLLDLKGDGEGRKLGFHNGLDKPAEPTFEFLEQSLANYTPGQTGTGYLTSVVPQTATFYMIDRSHGKIDQILSSLQNVTMRLETLPESPKTVFGVELEGTMFRAVRSKPDCGWPFLRLLDVGDVLPFADSMMLYQLTKFYQNLPPLAVRCQLVEVVDQPRCKDFNRYLTSNVYKTRKFEIFARDEDNLLHVKLSAVPKVDRNGVVKSKPLEPAPPEYKISEKTLTQEQLDILYEEPLNTTNVMKATLGYVPKDDVRICPFYDPAIQGCFKGAACRLEHVAKDPDGWTRDRALHKAKIRAQLVEPKIGAMVKLIPTTIVSVEEFYGQLDLKECSEGLRGLQQTLNDPMYVRDFREMDHKPYARELVFAFYAADGQWYRAEVLEYFHDGLVEVFYVDYGNKENVRLADLRLWDDRFDYLPFQAVHCRLANVGRLRDDDVRATEALREEILDRLVVVEVLDIRSYWEVLVYGAGMQDIGQLMVRRNMARTRQPIVISEKHGLVPA
ncbi:uncharacterized protein LOC5570125 isoform X2 [Aedes aegypti]|uniref:Uncharacterized protein n=1 Tax=Aedes aegypti TaxID=7159 RepID=A0A6I8TFU1_AEDAE|nr:uncharacterized protein LOC5570125 isoform X2 [Aedes aegypti]